MDSERLAAICRCAGDTRVEHGGDGLRVRDLCGEIKRLQGIIQLCPRLAADKKKVAINCREGPPRYYRPVCARTSLGFVGGPSGYMEVGEDERERGPVIVEDEGGG